VADQTETRIPKVVEQYESEILADWTKDIVRGASRGQGGISENEMRTQAGEFLNVFRRALRRGSDDVDGPEWEPAREMLGTISRSRGAQGFTPSETASFVFSMKRLIMARLRTEYAKDAQGARG
jgi:rsbT co-antagonist protein RsbR